jgi:hypothetical protein
LDGLPERTVTVLRKSILMDLTGGGGVRKSPLFADAFEISAVYCG